MICQTCKNAIFDAQWGEYKCGKNGITYHDLAFCGSYDKGTPAESKENEYYDRRMEE